MQIFFIKTNGNRNCSTTEKKAHTSLRMEMFIQYKHRRQCGRYHYRWKTLVITEASVFDISIMKRDKIIQIHQWLIKYNCIPPFLQVTSGVGALCVSLLWLLLIQILTQDACKPLHLSIPLVVRSLTRAYFFVLSKTQLFVILVLFSVNKQNSQIK